jgi:hypothetical protein
VTHLDVSKILPGLNPPDEINAVIEIPQGGVPVKYELDKVSGALFVNRFLHTAMYYPAPILRVMSEQICEFTALLHQVEAREATGTPTNR